MAELTQGRKREWDTPSIDHILTRTTGWGGQVSTTYLSHPLRGVVDEIKALDQTSELEAEYQRSLFSVFPRSKGDRKVTKDWLPYPYDVVRHIDKNEVLLPGLASDQLPAESQRTEWDYIKNEHSSDGKKQLLIGVLKSKWESKTRDYILNPQTMHAVTPAFDWLTEFNNDSAVIEIPNYRGKYYRLGATAALNSAIAPEVWQTGNEKYATIPDFMRGIHMSLKRVVDGELAVTTQAKSELVRINDQDIFDLEPLGVSADAQGRSVFDTTFKNIAAFAKVNNEVRNTMKQADATLKLPWVVSPRIDARLSFVTHANGGGVLSLAGAENDLRLTLEPDGSVMIGMYGTSPRELRSTDPEYVACMNAVSELLQEYFTRLYEENTMIDAEKLGVLRQKMGQGGIAGWNAVRKLRRNYKG